jgi:D-alanyl-D-alanine carboxypeptidase (penicillin-binding protein 5/6)
MNAGERLPIASATKLMTALVTLEHARLGLTFAQNNYRPSPVDSQIGLVPGERMTVRDLLLAMLLPSADDAAEDLAFNVGHHSVGRFVAMMNMRARALGLTHTHFSTPIGLDTPGNYSSASDLVALAGFLLEHHPLVGRAVAMPRAVLHSGARTRSITNRNDLVGRIRWINGVKTGHTLDAGYVLVGSGTRSGMTLISAVLGAASTTERDADTVALLRYGFSTFTLATPVRAGTVVATRSVRDQPGVRADVIAASTFSDVVRRGIPVTTGLRLPHQLAGPRKRHAVVGEIVVLYGGQPVARIPLLLARSLSAVPPLTVALHFLTPASTLLVLLALAAAAIALTVRRRERARGTEGSGLQKA